MHRSAILPAVLMVLAPLAGCDGGDEKKIVIGEAVECNYTLDNLDGSTWVMLEAKPEGSVENPMARLKWFTEDGVQKVKYTVKSPQDVYDYWCQRNGDEWQCREEEHLADWCQALEVHEENSCTPEKLRELGATSDDDTIATEMNKALANVKKFRDTENWRQFSLNNNNLGNKLQGLLDVKLDEKKCQLRITDMYMTIYNGQRITDSNPVGTNPFVESKRGDDFMWEHCKDPYSLVDYTEPALPEDLAALGAPRMYEVGQTIHWHYMGHLDNRRSDEEKAAKAKTLKAEEGCTYSMDTYQQWQKLGTDVAVQPDEEGNLDWHASHAYTDLDQLKWVADTQPMAIFHMVRNKTCGGKKETIDVVCSAAKIMP